jgi:hypothetical protein
MKTKTKFDINDIVYTIHDNKVQELRIYNIVIRQYYSKVIEIKYLLSPINTQPGSGEIVTKEEKEVFKTKKQLANSLL